MPIPTLQSFERQRPQPTSLQTAGRSSDAPPPPHQPDLVVRVLHQHLGEMKRTIHDLRALIKTYTTQLRYKDDQLKEKDIETAQLSAQVQVLTQQENEILVTTEDVCREIARKLSKAIAEIEIRRTPYGIGPGAAFVGIYTDSYNILCRIVCDFTEVVAMLYGQDIEAGAQ